MEIGRLDGILAKVIARYRAKLGFRKVRNVHLLFVTEGGFGFLAQETEVNARIRRLLTRAVG